MANRGRRILVFGSLGAIALVSWLATGALASTISAIDRFAIVRDGTSFFDDTFSDGLVPPSAPNLASGTPASYGLNGTYPTGAAAGSTDILASFQYFVDGVAVGTPLGLGTSTMFRGEDWLRASFFAAEAVVPEPSALVLLVTGLGGAAWIRRRHLIRK